MKLPTLSRLWKILRNAVAAVFGLAIVVALLPSKARSQLGLDPCCAMMQVGLNTISGLLRNSVAMPLGSIQQSQQQSANFEQQVVFPMAAISQARNMAVQFQSQFVQMRQLFQLPISSATLPHAATARTEPALRQSGRNAADHKQLLHPVWHRDAAGERAPTGSEHGRYDRRGSTSRHEKGGRNRCPGQPGASSSRTDQSAIANRRARQFHDFGSRDRGMASEGQRIHAIRDGRTGASALNRVGELERSAQVQRFSCSDTSVYGQPGLATGGSVAVFYFQQLLNTALAGIDGTAIISTVTNIAFAILLIGFLIGLYQAAFRGGDLQALAGTAIKYLVVAMIVSNWAIVFRGVNGSFNTIANSIGSSSGAGDMFQSWMGQLQQQFANNPSLTLTDIITGDAAATITVVLLVVAYLLYALAMIVFCFFYTLFGAILYVVGPLVLALIPIPGVGQLGKSYAVNVMIWNAWGILYAVFGALITAIQVNQVNNILGNGFLGFLKGAGDSIILGLVSIFYALAIALIPFIAKRIISGDVGSTVFALVRAGGVAAGAAMAGVSGFAAGASSGSAGATASGGVGASSTSTVLASSTAPPAPSMPDFIRSGVASAMNSNSSPAVPASNASSHESSGKRDLAAAMSGSSGRHGSSYRPHSVTQVVSFNVGRALGRAAGRNNADNN